MGGSGREKNDCTEFICCRVKVLLATFISFQEYFLKRGGLNKSLKRKRSDILTTSGTKSYYKQQKGSVPEKDRTHPKEWRGRIK